jgi:hypothetical protein
LLIDGEAFDRPLLVGVGGQAVAAGFHAVVLAAAGRIDGLFDVYRVAGARSESYI